MVLAADVVLPKVGKYIPSGNANLGARLNKKKRVIDRSRRRSQAGPLGECQVIENEDDYFADSFVLDTDSEDEADQNLSESGTLSENEYIKERNRNIDDREEVKASACRHVLRM